MNLVGWSWRRHYEVMFSYTQHTHRETGEQYRITDMRLYID